MTARAALRSADVQRVIQAAAKAGRPVRWLKVGEVVFGFEALTDGAVPALDAAPAEDDAWTKGMATWSAAGSGTGSGRSSA